MAAGKLSATTEGKDSAAVAECGRAQQIENPCEHYIVSVKQRDRRCVWTWQLAYSWEVQVEFPGDTRGRCALQR